MALHSIKQSDASLAAFEWYGHRVLSMDRSEISPTNDGVFPREIAVVLTAAGAQGG